MLLASPQPHVQTVGQRQTHFATPLRGLSARECCVQPLHVLIVWRLLLVVRDACTTLVLCCAAVSVLSLFLIVAVPLKLSLESESERHPFQQSAAHADSTLLHTWNITHSRRGRGVSSRDVDVLQCGVGGDSDQVSECDLMIDACPVQRGEVGEAVQQGLNVEQCSLL